MGGWVDSRPGLDAMEKRETLASYLNLEMTAFSLKTCKALLAGPYSAQNSVTDAWLIEIGEISFKQIYWENN
jgi:hypothetical protein